MKRVWTFFYGSFINLEVLEQYQVFPEDIHQGRLDGFDIDIAPLATLIRKDSSCVYGIAVKITHSELNTLYSLDWVERYDPEAVLVEIENGIRIPSITYISDPPQKSPPANDYVLRIIEPGKKWGFPDWYIQRLSKFLPPS